MGQAFQRSRIASAYSHHNYSDGVVMLVPDKEALHCPGVETESGSVCVKAVMELVIGDVVIRMGADIGETHLQRVILAW